MKMKSATAKSSNEMEQPPIVATIKLRITHTWEHDVRSGGSHSIGQIVDDMIRDALVEDKNAELHDLKIEFPNKELRIMIPEGDVYNDD
jgi:hypothetical protein